MGKKGMFAPQPGASTRVHANLSSGPGCLLISHPMYDEMYDEREVA